MKEAIGTQPIQTTSNVYNNDIINLIDQIIAEKRKHEISIIVDKFFNDTDFNYVNHASSYKESVDCIISKTEFIRKTLLGIIG